MGGADDWRGRSGAYIGRDSAGPSSDHRRPVWHRPPSLGGAAVAKIDGTVLDQPTRRLVRRSVVVGGDARRASSLDSLDQPALRVHLVPSDELIASTKRRPDDPKCR